MDDSYDHADPRLFYVSENCPGLGCPAGQFDQQLLGCACGTGCPADCPCGTRPVPGTRECGTGCACGPQCRYRVVQRGPRPGLTVFDAGERGWGLRTDLAIAAGEFVCCYAGEVIGAEEAARRFASQTEHNYILVVREHCQGRVVSETYIDATQVCNIGHYINHACRPNLALTPVRVDCAAPHAALFALRDIASGEELTFSYGGEVGPGSRPCLCGAPDCRGSLPSDPRLTGVTSDPSQWAESGPQPRPLT